MKNSTFQFGRSGCSLAEPISSLNIEWNLLRVARRGTSSGALPAAVSVANEMCGPALVDNLSQVNCIELRSGGNAERFTSKRKQQRDTDFNRVAY